MSMSNLEIGARIFESGRIVTNGENFHNFTEHIDINTSTILSTLIVAAGRVCKWYSSDLFHDWEWLRNEVERAIDNGENPDCNPHDVHMLISLRESGTTTHLHHDYNPISMNGMIITEKDALELYVIDVMFNGGHHGSSVSISLERIK